MSKSSVILFALMPAIFGFVNGQRIVGSSCDVKSTFVFKDDTWSIASTSDCFSSADDALKLCQRMFPDASINNVMPDNAEIRLLGFCDETAVELKSVCNGTIVFRPYTCLSGPFTNAALLVPNQCLFDPVVEHGECFDFDRWESTANDTCRARQLFLYSFSPMMPCSKTAHFSGAEVVCCHFERIPEPSIFRLGGMTTSQMPPSAASMQNAEPLLATMPAASNFSRLQDESGTTQNSTKTSNSTTAVIKEQLLGRSETTQAELGTPVKSLLSTTSPMPVQPLPAVQKATDEMTNLFQLSIQPAVPDAGPSDTAEREFNQYLFEADRMLARYGNEHRSYRAAFDSFEAYSDAREAELFQRWRNNVEALRWNRLQLRRSQLPGRKNETDALMKLDELSEKQLLDKLRDDVDRELDERIEERQVLWSVHKQRVLRRQQKHRDAAEGALMRAIQRVQVGTRQLVISVRLSQLEVPMVGLTTVFPSWPFMAFQVDAIRRLLARYIKAEQNFRYHWLSYWLSLKERDPVEAERIEEQVRQHLADSPERVLSIFRLLRDAIPVDVADSLLDSVRYLIEEYRTLDNNVAESFPNIRRVADLLKTTQLPSKIMETSSSPPIASSQTQTEPLMAFGPIETWQQPVQLVHYRPKAAATEVPSSTSLPPPVEHHIIWQLSSSDNDMLNQRHQLNERIDSSLLESRLSHATVGNDGSADRALQPPGSLGVALMTVIFAGVLVCCLIVVTVLTYRRLRNTNFGWCVPGCRLRCGSHFNNYAQTVVEIEPTSLHSDLPTEATRCPHLQHMQLKGYENPTFAYFERFRGELPKSANSSAHPTKP